MPSQMCDLCEEPHATRVHQHGKWLGYLCEACQLDFRQRDCPECGFPVGPTYITRCPEEPLDE